MDGRKSRSADGKETEEEEEEEEERRTKNRLTETQAG